MLHGLWKLTWLEIKIFMREPMGAVGAIVIPVLVFLVVGRIEGWSQQAPPQDPGIACGHSQELWPGLIGIRLRQVTSGSLSGNPTIRPETDSSAAS